jgi:hypothetical protein
MIYWWRISENIHLEYNKNCTKQLPQGQSIILYNIISLQIAKVLSTRLKPRHSVLKKCHVYLIYRNVQVLMDMTFSHQTIDHFSPMVG